MRSCVELSRDAPHSVASAGEGAQLGCRLDSIRESHAQSPAQHDGGSRICAGMLLRVHDIPRNINTCVPRRSPVRLAAIGLEDCVPCSRNRDVPHPHGLQ